MHLLVELDIPLIVDLDGTLIKSDSLHKHLISFIFHHPEQLMTLARAATKGRAPVKEVVAAALGVDVGALRFREQILVLAREAKASGRAVHLVTAVDQSVAATVAAHLGLFDSVKGSGGKVNLEGRNKLDWLRAQFPQGFIYVGGSAADLPIWREAKVAILVGDGAAHAESLRADGVPVQILTDGGANVWRDWLSALRLHQWTKNLLIFVPLFLGHIAGDIAAWTSTIAGFFVFGAVASATYLVNDLADLGADRLHSTKRFRAIASGRIVVGQAAGAAVVLILVGLALAFALQPEFAATICVYLILTLAYSFWLKLIPLIDVAAIGGLFTLRLVMGTVLNHLVLSPWLLSFSICFFYALALAKRHVEVMRAGARHLENIRGRGYTSADWPLTLGFGIGAAMASIVVMLLFVAEAAGQSGAYRSPQWLYVAPACVFLWVQRIWLLSHRMKLDDDPIVFALKDRQSYLLGAIIVVGFLLAL